MPTLAIRPGAHAAPHALSESRRSHDPVFATVDGFRAREADLITPDAQGAILMSWLTGPGHSGQTRAQEILDLFATEKHNGVIWTVHNYFINNPTGNYKVDQLDHWGLLRALGISNEGVVDRIKTFLKHVVMNTSAFPRKEPAND